MSRFVRRQEQAYDGIGRHVPGAVHRQRRGVGELRGRSAVKQRGAQTLSVARAPGRSQIDAGKQDPPASLEPVLKGPFGEAFECL